MYNNQSRTSGGHAVDRSSPTNGAQERESETPITIYKEFEDMPLFQDGKNLQLLAGILRHGFEKPSTIQQKVIVPLSTGRNVIAQSQSGTGKTGSFVIGCLSRLDPSVPHVQIIIMAHTHELAQQICSVLVSIGTDLLKSDKVELCVGKRVAVEENIRRIDRGAQVLVGTPGRICDLVSRVSRTGKKLIDPQHVKVVILDEADRLLSFKFNEEISDIVNALDDSRRRSEPLQLGIFSATLPPEEREALEYARDLCGANRPIEILIPVPELSLEGIAQYYYDFNGADSRDVFREKVQLISILHEDIVIPQCIIYVNSAKTADMLQEELRIRELNTQCIYGSMSPRERMDITDRFRRSEIRVLISTDLLSRGFDVQQISLVINFDLPYVTDRRTGDIDQEKMAEYLHRIGRSGRFGRKGLAINFVATDGEMARLREIERYYGTDIRLLPNDVASLF